ncbi:3207_t:CDS:2 [Acaulospora colombiana]|uniref:3207_t:CDS:1 n=1 Tax=Acaulospora colombiana TaxID=27376 RepID=A0ACA9KFN0_9GLOM|nr:3207_t:CDS:2 [Acaulospora colombiana]
MTEIDYHIAFLTKALEVVKNEKSNGPENCDIDQRRNSERKSSDVDRKDSKGRFADANEKKSKAEFPNVDGRNFDDKSSNDYEKKSKAEFPNVDRMNSDDKSSNYYEKNSKKSPSSDNYEDSKEKFIKDLFHLLKKLKIKWEEFERAMMGIIDRVESTISKIWTWRVTAELEVEFTARNQLLSV